MYELLHNNRTIGADDRDIGEKVAKLYASFCQGEIVVTDIKTAEMTKVIENTFRCVNIAFANELAKICRHDNMDVYEIIRICNMHPRVNILQPGPGVGGHCISVDPWFLVGDYPSLAKVIDESMKTNDSMPDFVLNRIYEIMKENGLRDITKVGLYGLTYKEDVDDMRESPTLQLLESQERHLATGLKVYDPFIKGDVVKNQYHDLDTFLKAIDFVVIMVHHNEIRENMDKVKPIRQGIFNEVRTFKYERVGIKDYKHCDYIRVCSYKHTNNIITFFPVEDGSNYCYDITPKTLLIDDNKPSRSELFYKKYNLEKRI